MAYQKYSYQVIREVSKDRDDAIYEKVSQRAGVPKEVASAVIELGFKCLGQAMKQTLTGRDVVVVLPHIGQFYSTEEYKKKKKKDNLVKKATSYKRLNSKNQNKK